MADTGLIDQAVAALGARLRGLRRRRAGLLDEARDGLHDAAQAHRATGLDAADAERRAVAEFGSPAELAPLYQDELAATQGRRTGALMAVAMPALVLAWGWDLWPAQPDTDPSTSKLDPLIDLISVVTALIAVAGIMLLGLGARRRISPRWLAAGVALVGALALLLTLSSAIPLLLEQSGQSPPPTARPLRFVISAIVLGYLAWSVRRCIAVSTLGGPTGSKPGPPER